MKPPVIETERLILRALDARDAPALFALYSDPDVMRYWSHEAWMMPAQARAAIAEAHQDYADGRSLHLAIEHRDSGSLVGSCALYELMPLCRRATLGYLLARPHWGFGYGREALAAMLGYGFTGLGLNRVEAEVEPRNHASIKLLEQLRFRREGTMRERWIVAEEPRDIAAYALLRSDWMS
ncbi:GNAT family N-acetyltransferase [Pseudoduganella sp. RAF53_2]|uniref:GNAT family N-acetyltransferase n=1 Tax=unclassified Pseudoduganella TaxID=2637179 RepID=UPI003F9E219E